MTNRLRFIQAGLSDDGARVYLYPKEGCEPVMALVDGTSVYYEVGE